MKVILRRIIHACMFYTIMLHGTIITVQGRRSHTDTVHYDATGVLQDTVMDIGMTDMAGGQHKGVHRGVNTMEQLHVCECEEANGSPYGLSCGKEGYFVAGFERQGQWMTGGAVPLSRAMCCRPCVPDRDEIPSSVDDDPLAIVSIGCHASSDKLRTRCEENSNNLVTGFTNAARVFGPGATTYYPMDAAECCLPSVLLKNGDVLELSVCDCHSSEDEKFPINCGGNSTHTLLAGFNQARISPSGHLVPVGEANCCGICISKNSRIHPMDDCGDLNMCHGRGACILGRCECFPGWGGSDCSARTGVDDDIPGWAIVLIVLGSCLMGILVLGVLAYIAEVVADWRSESGDGGSTDGSTRQPLLIHIDHDDDGSVGSRDTESTEVSEIEDRIQHAQRELNEGEDEDDTGSVQSRDDAVPERVQEGDHAGHSEDATDTSPDSAQEVVTHQVTTSLQNDGHDGEHEQCKTEDGKDDLEKKKKDHHPRIGDGVLGEIICTVCMDRPVQTAIVPCGHVCMCRRCSRRLKRCPVCRCTIARRQKLYV